MARSSSARWRAGVAGADAREAAARRGSARRSGSSRSAAELRWSSPSPSRGDEEVLAGRNRPSRRPRARETSGMPQASASKTRMVGMPGSGVDVEAARHVDGGEVAGEDLRRARRSAASRGSGAVAARAWRSAASRVAHAVDVERQAGARRRARIRKVSSSSVRSPSPQLPIQTRPVAGLGSAGGWKQRDVGGLVPDEDARRPSPSGGRPRRSASPKASTPS